MGKRAKSSGSKVRKVSPSVDVATKKIQEKYPIKHHTNSCERESLGASCIALTHNGKITKVHGDCTEDLLPTLQDSSMAWVNFIVSDVEKDGSEIAMKLGFSQSLIPSLMKGYYASLEDNIKELGIMVPAVIIDGLDLKSHPLLILVRKDLIVTIHPQAIERLIIFSKYAEHFVKRLPPDMPIENKLTMMLVRILDENNTRNFDQLREIEEQSDDMSEIMLDPNAPRTEIAKRIYRMKHTLITYLNTLWRTLDVLHTLRFGDAELISDDPKVLIQVGLLGDDVNRQIALSEHMSTVLSGGLEVLQTLYNNQLQILNNRMSYTITWLTILGTAVLVPNTLATIMGSITSMEMPMLVWYLTVMTWATIGATYLAWWWVRRKVNLPTKTD